jgi:hypothetical protein
MREQRRHRWDRLSDVVSLSDTSNGSQRFDDHTGFGIVQAAEQDWNVRRISSAPEQEAAPLAHARSTLGGRLLNEGVRLGASEAFDKMQRGPLPFEPIAGAEGIDQCTHHCRIEALAHLPANRF